MYVRTGSPAWAGAAASSASARTARRSGRSRTQLVAWQGAAAGVVGHLLPQAVGVAGAVGREVATFAGVGAAVEQPPPGPAAAGDHAQVRRPGPDVVVVRGGLDRPLRVGLGARQERRQVDPLHRCGHGHARRREHSGREVVQRREEARRRPCRAALGMPDEERHVDHLGVHLRGRLADEAAVGERDAVVGEHDDERPLAQPQLVEALEERAEPVVGHRQLARVERLHALDLARRQVVVAAVDREDRVLHARVGVVVALDVPPRRIPRLVRVEGVDEEEEGLRRRGVALEPPRRRAEDARGEPVLLTVAVPAVDDVAGDDLAVGLRLLVRQAPQTVGQVARDVDAVDRPALRQALLHLAVDAHEVPQVRAKGAQDGLSIQVLSVTIAVR